MTILELQEKLIEAKNMDPKECACACRAILSDAIDIVYEQTRASKPQSASLLELIYNSAVLNYVDDQEIIASLHFIRILGMNAEHDIKVRKLDVKLAYENMEFFLEWLKNKNGINFAELQKPVYMSEAATRRLYVDVYLREAGWEVLDAENVMNPGKAGIEIEVEGMPNTEGVGYCDYVLYGRDGKPLAIVEVKKTSKDPEVGRHQVDLYGECMKNQYGYKPILYYTNGYTTKIIDGIYPDREVSAFHSINELELLIQRRNRNQITNIEIDDNITDRPYQKMAITGVCELFNANKRRGLLVMATGTGKTRVAISIVDVLAKNNWVKNVLFLADRTALVSQAKRNFNKLLPNMSVCELSGSGEKDYNARLMFSTYQTMINYIDAEEKKFTCGRFDLIIIDEAHRSIFNKYASIFNYFDSLLIGLTATPKDEVVANTYHIFGCEPGIPNFDYSLEEAIKDHYLVGYQVVNRDSLIIRDGINYNKLSQEEKDQLDEYFEEDPPTPDFNIPGNEIFRKIYNKDTCNKVLEEVMNLGIKVEHGEKLGKTIIFAYNHRHAQMIVDCFRELYPEYPANTCQLIDYSVNYSDDLILQFENDDDFRIAVSVDKLDTGIDVTSILNLVFFKPLKSKIKFMQMIGRGTRLCPNVFGPGQNKDKFLIFDYCGNFEYFEEEYENETISAQPLSLSQRLFSIKLDLLFELQRIEYQEDEESKAYYLKIKDELFQQIQQIKSHSNRIQVRERMMYIDKYCDIRNWDSLSALDVKEIKKYIIDLLDSGIEGNELSIAYDIRMLDVELSLLAKGDTTKATKDVINIRKISKYLLDEKASIPQVFAQANNLRTLVSEVFWQNAKVSELENLRKATRDLMQFLDSRSMVQIDVNIVDDITDSEYTPAGTNIDIRTYREKVLDYLIENSDNPVIKKIYNLEPINENDVDELEHILWEELGSKEEYEAEVQTTNLAVFIRSLIGLSKECINEKFGEFLSGNTLNLRQQEFIKAIIDYALQNGDIMKEDLVNKAPFNNYDLIDLFGNVAPVIKVVEIIHGCVTAA